MSHFTTVRTLFVMREHLLAALEEMGFKKIEVHEEAQHLRGYLGDKRKQTAEIIIRKKYVGRMSNDIGFKTTDKGTYDAIISRFDRAKYNKNWMGKLSQRYAYRATLAKLEEQGFDLTEEKKEGDKIHLSLRRTA